MTKSNAPLSTKTDSATHISAKESPPGVNAPELKATPDCHLPIVRPGMTLWAIMDTLEQMERGLLELTPDEMKEIGGATRAKVDGYKQFTDMAKGVGEMIGNWEDELAQARKSLENKVSGLKSHMHNLMTTFGFEKLPGHVYEARLQKNPPRLVMNPERAKADISTYAEFPNFIKTSYSWDNDAVKKAIQGGSTQFVEFATVEQGTSLRFGVNKEA